MLSVVVHSFYVYYSTSLLLLENLINLLFISLHCVAEHSWVKLPGVVEHETSTEQTFVPTVPLLVYVFFRKAVLLYKGELWYNF